jgi:hypothetical protein
MSHYQGSTKQAVSWGMTGFAGILLLTVGVFQVLQGISALAADDIFVSGPKYVYELDVTAWGWVHLVLGVIAGGTGVGLLMGQNWARGAAFVIAVLGAIANFAFIPVYPVWSLVIVAFNAGVIWAVCVQMANAD